MGECVRCRRRGRRRLRACKDERAWLDFVDGRMPSYNATSRDNLDIVVDGANGAEPTTVVFVCLERHA